MTKKLWVKEEHPEQIPRHEKTVEVRVGYPNILHLKVGDVIHLNDCYLATIRQIACSTVSMNSWKPKWQAQLPRTHLWKNCCPPCVRSTYPQRSPGLLWR